MANGRILEPFIKSQEGGLSRATTDLASKNPCPYEFNGITGFHTNKGITWPVFVSLFGDSQESADRFFAMSDDDWYEVFYKLYWNKCFADQILSQRIANVIVDFVWASGFHTPELDIQEVLNILGGHLSLDGDFGPATISTINSLDEKGVYDGIVAKHIAYVSMLIENNPSQAVYRIGWLNRINSLVEFNQHL